MLVNSTGNTRLAPPLLLLLLAAGLVLALGLSVGGDCLSDKRPQAIAVQWKRWGSVDKKGVQGEQKRRGPACDGGAKSEANTTVDNNGDPVIKVSSLEDGPLLAATEATAR